MVTFRGTRLTTQNMLRALGEFDRLYPNTNDYDDWLYKGNYVYALDYNDRLYPPKKILSMASGIPTNEFYGGRGETNRVFEKLGFNIILK